jgi:hypothetical protein
VPESRAAGRNPTSALLLSTEARKRRSSPSSSATSSPPSGQLARSGAPSGRATPFCCKEALALLLVLFPSMRELFAPDLVPPAMLLGAFRGSIAVNLSHFLLQGNLGRYRAGWHEMAAFLRSKCSSGTLHVVRFSSYPNYNDFSIKPEMKDNEIDMVLYFHHPIQIRQWSRYIIICKMRCFRTEVGYAP